MEEVVAIRIFFRLIVFRATWRSTSRGLGVHNEARPELSRAGLTLFMT